MARLARAGTIFALEKTGSPYGELVNDELPDRFEGAWSLIQRGAEAQEEFDTIDAFETWVYSDA